MLGYSLLENLPLEVSDLNWVLDVVSNTLQECLRWSFNMPCQIVEVLGLPQMGGSIVDPKEKNHFPKKKSYLCRTILATEMADI